MIDQLKEHLEEFCTNRTAAETTKKDILNGNVYTEEGKHKFIFHKFYHGHLLKKKMARETTGYTTNAKRIL